MQSVGSVGMWHNEDEQWRNQARVHSPVDGMKKWRRRKIVLNVEMVEGEHSLDPPWHLVGVPDPLHLLWLLLLHVASVGSVAHPDSSSLVQLLLH